MTVAVLLLGGGSPARAALDAAERAEIRGSGRVGADLLAALEEGSEVQVIVVFELPENERRAPRGRAALKRRVRSVAARREALLAGMPAGELRVGHRFGAVNAFSASLTSRGLLRLIRHPHVKRIDLDRPVRVNLDQALPLVNLYDLHSAGFEGAGVRVGIVDTGIDSDHPDLADAIVGERCYCTGNCCPDGSSDQEGVGSAEDDHQHGTFMAGIITSESIESPLGGAPAAQIVAVKSLGSNGTGQVSDVVAGLDWILTERPDVNVVNLSLGTSSYTGDCDDADADTMAYASSIDALRANGVLTFSATGNEGSGTQMDAPACVKNAVSVSAVWDAVLASHTVLGCTDDPVRDLVACWSNSNDKTDLFAPGARISAAKLGGGSIAGFGTSLASPIAAACAAVLLQIRPLASPDQIETALEGSPVRVTDPTNGLDFPRVDCLAASELLDGVFAPQVPTLSAWATALLGAVFVVGGWLNGRGRRRRTSGGRRSRNPRPFDNPPRPSRPGSPPSA